MRPQARQPLQKIGTVSKEQSGAIRATASSRPIANVWPLHLAQTPTAVSIRGTRLRTSGRVLHRACLDGAIAATAATGEFVAARGNFGEPGGGISPIRGHSSVQGNRTVGIDEEPSQEYLDRVWF